MFAMPFGDTSSTEITCVNKKTLLEQENMTLFKNKRFYKSFAHIAYISTQVKGSFHYECVNVLPDHRGIPDFGIPEAQVTTQHNTC